MYELLSSDDINFYNILVKGDAITDTIEYSVKPLRRDEVAKGIVGLMLALLAPFCQYRFGVSYNEELYKKFLTRNTYDHLITNFYISAESVKMSDMNNIRKTFKRENQPCLNGKLFDFFREILFSNKKKIESSRISGDGYRIFEFLYKIYINPIDSPIDWSSLKKIILPSIVDTLLKEVLSSMKTNYSSFDLSKNTSESITASFFDAMHPSHNDVLNFCVSSPIRFYEWRNAMLAISKANKSSLSKIWKEQNLPSIVAAPHARNLCKTLGIACPIDTNFSGMVGISKYIGSLFSFYTKKGKPISGIPGIDLEMNSGYKEDNTYFCSAFTQNNLTGNRIRFYSQEYLEKMSPIHYKVMEAASAIEGFRDSLYRDLSSDKYKSYAVPLLLSDLFILPISDTLNRGINTIKISDYNDGHIYVGSNKYIDCNKFPKNVQTAFFDIINSEKSKKYVFSSSENSPITVKDLRRYAFSRGFPLTLDSMRKYRANVLFSSNLDQGFDNALEITSSILSITINTCLRSYLDPVFIKNYFDAGNEKPSRAVRSIIKELPILAP